jgi:hypothetical protein
MFFYEMRTAVAVEVEEERLIVLCSTSVKQGRQTTHSLMS